MALTDLNDLRLLAAVVGNGGFSAAARALSIPKSRISRRISALEDELGVRLVERSTRRFKVTEIRHEIYQRARAALAEAETIEDAAARLKTEPQGLVRISCPLGADRLLGARLPAFLAKYPKLRIQMIVTNRRINLIDEGVDVALRVREQLDSDADLQLKVIARTVSRLTASPALLDELGRPSRLEHLRRFPTLAHGEQPGTNHWTLVGPEGQEADFAHEPRLASTNFGILRQAAVDGLGVAFLPELEYRQFLEDGRLEPVLPEWGSREATLHLVYTSRRGLLPGVRAVIDFAAEVLKPCGR
jgi:DNA-binding transcriptional LysR family regulator